MATQYFKRNLPLNLYRKGKKLLLVCVLLPLKRDKNVWRLLAISSIWRPLAFLPVTLSFWSTKTVKSLFFLLLENFRPLSPRGPLDFLSTCLGNVSLIPPFSFRRIMLPREKGRHSHSITTSELTRGIAPKLVRQHILLILILRISDPGAPNSSWRKLQQ